MFSFTGLAPSQVRLLVGAALSVQVLPAVDSRMLRSRANLRVHSWRRALGEWWCAASDVLARCMQVKNMCEKHHVYMTRDGRISLAGLSAAKTPMLAAAMVDSFKV